MSSENPPERPRIEPTQLTDVRQFGHILYAARISAGLSINDVASALGLSGGLVRYRETGARQCTIRQAIDHLNLCGYALFVMPHDRTVEFAEHS